MRTFVAALSAKVIEIAAASTTKPSVMVTLITGALAHFTYVALIAILVIAGTGVPIPEDIPLIFSGYLCNKHHSPIKDMQRWVDVNGDGVKEPIARKIPQLRYMIMAGMLGVLIGDSIVFTIGRHGLESNNFVTRHLKKVMHSKRREKVERHFAKHGNLTVFVGRFMPGFRGIVFAFAGLSKMSYFRFLLIDGVAAAISVPVFVYIGFRFAENIHKVFDTIDRVKHIVLPVVVLALVAAGLIYLVRRRRTAIVHNV